MKKLVFLAILLLLCSDCFAEKNIKLDSIGFGKLLHIAGHIQLPSGQKLNKAAPSKIAIYEKEGKSWVLTEEVNLNDFFVLTELINFQRPVRLHSDKSEIKVEASLYHCPKLGRGICVIDDFEGLIKRNSKKVSSEVQVSLIGSTPK
ncbi:hypothetical protein ACLVWU_08360 [Bdellovibrio sp. HCB290]|uniref:hypothetical protein n=1 Tax=Bdellovibrio sp. HCB290 TaxID=3394356 RepID=UPI0039B42E9C